MASEIDVCNLALSHLGNARRVAAIDPPDGTAEADLCAAFLPLARAELLEMADWTFARHRGTLAPLATNPSTLWQYAYARPADCIVPRRILTGDAALKELDSYDFTAEGDALLSNAPEAVLVYTRPVDDMTRFSSTAVTALSYLLASYLAGPIIKGDEGAKASASLRKAASGVALNALANDSNRATAEPAHVPSAIMARNGWAPVTSSATDYSYETGYAVS